MASEAIRWLSTAEAAELLGITPRTLYRLIATGELAAYRFSRVIRLKESDVLAFVKSSRVRPGTLGHLYPSGGGD